MAVQPAHVQPHLLARHPTADPSVPSIRNVLRPRLASVRNAAILVWAPAASMPAAMWPIINPSAHVMSATREIHSPAVNRKKVGPRFHLIHTEKLLLV